MTDQELINHIADVVRKKLEGEGSGHDWWHVYRVWKMAERICRNEGADTVVVELAALLHDIADWKFHGGDDTVGPRVAGEILTASGVSPERIEAIRIIIMESSFKGAGVDTTPSTTEGKVVQDADRLDAIGAIGIARTFAYGGHKGRAMYDPALKPVLHMNKEAYAINQSPTINHFYEKLFLLKELMNTRTAKELAEKRHTFMKEYIDRFFKEWEGEV